MDRVIPLSAHLKVATDLADQNGPPQLQSWLRSEGDPSQWMDDVLPDEVEIYEVIGRLIKKLQRFPAFTPILISSLYHAHEAAAEDPDAYFQEVLSEQRDGILQACEQLPALEELERQLARLIKGTDQLFAEFNRLSNEADDFQTFLNSGYIKPLRQRRGESEESLQQRALRYGQKIYKRRKKAFQQKLRRLTDLSILITEREHKIQILERQVGIRRNIDRRLKQIDLKIGSLPESETPSISRQPHRLAAAQKPRQAPQTRGRHKRHKSHSSARRRSKRKDPTPPTTPPESEDGQSLTTIGPLNLSLQKIREAIALAGQNGNRMRILITNEAHRTRFITQWQQLLDQMQFTGTVEFTDFPRNDGDLSPILIPRGMNTHGSQWDRTSLEAPYFVIDIDRPNLLRNHLESET
ncbi:hypothetical protein HOM98_02515 [Candidatus Peregrinibacteria bacterium]|jgi:hypothetical protein|nr:hypothetical protein [Candidatus Peregrinibacteria bacterium]MBT7484088.1 hypothetical protein [Candidatus Peregrinibacteria bacterium]